MQDQAQAAPLADLARFGHLAPLASFARALRFEDLPAALVHDCRRRITDTLGCGLAALDAPPVRMARELALRAAPPSGGASLIGQSEKALPELAALANGVACRYAEGNDVFPGAGHPSDCLAAVLAAAESAGAGGREVITANVIAYQAYHHLFTALRLRDKGFDYVLYTAAASALACAKLLGCTAGQMADAMAMAITANPGLAVTRRGHLSMWKGVAGPNAAHAGLLAALMAAKGMTGPAGAVDGAHGIAEIAGRWDPPALPRLTAEGQDDWAMLRADHKALLAEYHSQAPIDCALALRMLIAPEDIDSVTVYSYRFTVQEIGGDREKWHPRDRESADHSLPWVLAAVLVHGRFGDELFGEAALADPRIHAMADRIEILEDPDYTQGFPVRIPSRIDVRLHDGRHETASVAHPRGHHRNPMGDEELQAKFRKLAARALPANRIEPALAACWGIEGVTDLRTVFDALR